MSSAEKQVRAALGGPDLWIAEDGNIQGYKPKPGDGPWWSAESVSKLVDSRDGWHEAAKVLPAEGELTMAEDGDANHYALMQNGDWLMSVLLNGKLMEAKQLATLRRMVACWNACVGLSDEQVNQVAKIGKASND